jgi:hypothetical protein
LPVRSGLILYLKPAYHGLESAGVRSYASKFPQFPHETTLNQWFSESQFESYRSLGFEITDSVLRGAILEIGNSSPCDLGTVLHTLMKRAKMAMHAAPAEHGGSKPVEPALSPAAESSRTSTHTNVHAVPDAGA